MRTLNAFYFSGTGNTRYVTRRLCRKLSVKFRTSAYDITDKADFSALLKGADIILLAYPIYGSAPPIPMCEFVHRYGADIAGKEVIIVVTQYLFSGDGAASLGRMVEKLGGNVTFAEHFFTPNNLADCSMFPIWNGEDLRKTLNRSEKKIDAFAERIIKGRPFRRGYGVVSHAVGYFCQRKLWRKNQNAKRNSLHINAQKCIGCGLCARQCPVKNIIVSEGRAQPLGNCVFCYRCVNSCPKKAITLVGKGDHIVQYRGIEDINGRYKQE